MDYLQYILLVAGLFFDVYEIFILAVGAGELVSEQLLPMAGGHKHHTRAGHSYVL